MQLLQLLEGLTPTELTKLERQVKEGGKKEAVALFRELKKCLGGKKEYNHEAVFSQVFSQPYSRPKSYLLKNEVRNLKKVIQQFFVELHIEDRLKNDPAFFNISLMKELAKREVKDIFEPEIEQLIDEAGGQDELEKKVELMRLKREYYQKNSFTPIETYISFLKTLRHNLIKKLLVDIRTAELDMALQTRIANYKAKGATYIHDTHEVDQLGILDPEPYETPLSQFLKMKTGALALSGEAKLARDMELLQFVESQQPIPTVDHAQINALLVDIIDLCGRLDRMEESAMYFDKFLNSFKDGKVKLSAIDHRYITIKLVVFGKCQEAVDHYYAYEKEILDSKISLDICHTMCYTFLFLKQSKEAITIINQFFRDDYDRFQADAVERLKRNVYIASFIVDDDLEGATREWQNYKRTTAYKSINSPIGQHIAKYFEAYLKIANGEKMQVKPQMNELLAEMKRYAAGLGIYCTPIEWLIYHIQSRFGA